jgi:hypothetical protein
MPGCVRASIGIAALALSPLACSGSDGDTNPSTGLTLGHDVTDGGNDQSEAPDDHDQGNDEGPKLDSQPDETAEAGADDGTEPKDCIEDVDIVFVMDVSTTMGPFFDKLEAEIAVVHEALMAYDLPNPPHYGLAVFVDDFKLINAGTPYTDINQLSADFAYWNSFTATNQQTSGGGFNSTWTENSLDPLYAAANLFQWRPKDSTLRIVIHTTDDTFWDGPTTGNGVQILRSYGETVEALQANEVRVFSFAAHIGGQCGCDDVSMGFFTDYNGQPAIPAATGGAAYSIGAVLSGMISLSQAIADSVEDSYCEDYPPVG